MISSQLQSQLFSKKATKWVLVRKGLIWSETNPHLENLKIQVFTKCVLVSLPKNPITGEKGFSVFISMYEYLDYIIKRSTVKAEGIECTRMIKTAWLVESFQDKQDCHTVSVYPDKVSCSCMLYKCLNKRIKLECPYFYKLMQKDDFFCGQVVCHHIYRVLNELRCWNLYDYLISA